MTRVAVTGIGGFLGWHLSCHLGAVHGVDVVGIGREELQDPVRLADVMSSVDTVYHLAGVNRAADDGAVEHGNLDLARQLAAGLERATRPVHLVYANSIQADNDSAYGRGKSGAAGILRDASSATGGTVADVYLPNLFGEHGRPAYNSFVATFADAVAHDRTPTVTGDREVPLLHAQAAAAVLVEAAAECSTHEVRPPGSPHLVSEVLARLVRFHDLYAVRGEIPDLSEPFAVDLFNTYRSYLFPHRFPLRPVVHSDQRGDLFETVRSHGGTGQAFVSSTVPGATRGDHYHLRKVERFFVLRGEAEIALRRLGDAQVVRFRVSGTQPSFVDMPTLWVHNIRNVGESELVTLFWADQLLDPADPDQYPQRVEADAS